MWEIDCGCAGANGYIKNFFKYLAIVAYCFTKLLN